MRKPYEYDYNKKERHATMITIIIILILAIIGYVLFTRVITDPLKEEQGKEQTGDMSWINEQFWIALDAPLQNDKENRSPANYYNVIAQFRVEDAARYAPNDGETFCNIFVWDVCRAMGTVLPQYYTEDLMPAEMDNYYYTGSANVRACFLEVRGREYGWKEVDTKTAQARADEGYPTIAVWKNSSAEADENGVCAHRPSGHIMVVRPSPTGVPYRRAKGPFIAQAGETNTMIANLSDVMNFIKRSQVVYYTHD